MPYVVTTKPDACPEGMAECRCVGHTRRAVATRDEAIDWIASPDSPAITYGQLIALDKTITESGGTVGPLPDGTLIEVERVEWQTLIAQADFVTLPSPVDSASNATEIIAAFNATQAVEA